MSVPAPQFATVVHLTLTGHVLAVVSSGSVEPTLEQLTGAGADGGGHLRVRIVGDAGFVNVPAAQLKAARLAVTDDVLERPQSFVVGAGIQPLQQGPSPVNRLGQAIAAGVPGAKVVVVWQTGDEAVVEDGVLDTAGAPPALAPSGATHRLVAAVGGPLYVVEL